MRRNDNIEQQIKQIHHEFNTYIKKLSDKKNYQSDLACMSAAEQNPITPDILVNLYIRMHMHGVTLDKEWGVTIAVGICGIGLLATSAFTFFSSFGSSAPVSGGIAAAGVAMLGTATGIHLNNIKKDKNIGEYEKKILILLKDKLLYEQDYGTYVLANLAILKKAAEHNKASLISITGLGYCLSDDNFKKNSHNLYDTCYTLLDNSWVNLFFDNSEIALPVKELLEVLTLEMMKQNHFGEYIKINLLLIANDAKLRDQKRNQVKTERNETINEIVSSMNANASPEEIEAALTRAISRILVESKTSDTAKDIKKLLQKFKDMLANTSVDLRKSNDKNQDCEQSSYKSSLRIK